jgi:hypothetical protein
MTYTGKSIDKSRQDCLTPLKLDPDDYREDSSELTKEQENELLQALWHIMSTFVDIGWGVDSVQLFLPDLFEKAVQDSDKLLQQKDAKTNNDTAKTKAVRKDKYHDR